MQTCRVYIYHIYSIYTFLYSVFISLKCHKNIRLTSIGFGRVHSNLTVVILLHKHFSSWLSTFCNFVSIVMNCMYTNMSEWNVTTYVKNLFTFFRLASYVYFLFFTNGLLPIFHLDCSRWCRFAFFTHFGSKSQWCLRGNYTAARLYHQFDEFTHMTDSLILTSHSISLQNKASVSRDSLCQNMLNQKISYRLCQIVVNWKRSHSSKSGVNFEVAVNWNCVCKETE